MLFFNQINYYPLGWKRVKSSQSRRHQARRTIGWPRVDHHRQRQEFLATCLLRTYQAWQRTSPVASMIACPFCHPSPYLVLSLCRNPLRLNSKSMATKRSRSWLIIFFQEKETEDKEVTKAQLEAEWAKFKFDLDAWKSLVPPSAGRGSSEKSAPTPLEWALQ